MSNQLSWIAIGIASLRFRAAIKAQNKEHLLPFKTWTYPWGSVVLCHRQFIPGIGAGLEQREMRMKRVYCVLYCTYGVAQPLVAIRHITSDWSIVCDGSICIQGRREDRGDEILKLMLVISSLQSCLGPPFLPLPSNAFQVRFELRTHGDDALEMLHLHLNGFLLGLTLLERPMSGQHYRHLQRVPDLPAIPLEIPNVRIIQHILLRVLVDLHLSGADRTGLSRHLGEEAPPDLLARFVAEAVVRQHDRDAGQDRVVDLADTVGGQEEQPAEVLEPSQEDGDDGVAPNVPRDAPFEEDVGFVEQEDGVPALREREPLLQLLVDVVSSFQEVVHGESDEGAASRLGDALHAVCFADARGAVEKDDLAFAFLGDGV